MMLKDQGDILASGRYLFSRASLQDHLQHMHKCVQMFKSAMQQAQSSGAALSHLGVPMPGRVGGPPGMGIMPGMSPGGPPHLQPSPMAGQPGVPFRGQPGAMPLAPHQMGPLAPPA